MHEETLFIEAMEIRDAAEQAAYLDRVCAGDAALRVRLERLLDEHRRAGSFLGHPAVAPGATRTFDPSPEVETTALPGEHVGTQIGPYKLRQQIGEGGMGTVFMAEQTHPVKRKVALKVIKPGMDSRQVVARFEAERQALAMMDHVNIARVFDGGATESGRPYFVMELIHGVPITKYCDDNHLTPRERLELFVPVCQAIQHAHQKGIIHRDIKPSNVMVTLYDGKPVPKVIDFGVAKATEQKLTERTLFTQYGTMVGTLEYMSPEQAEMSALGVDTRSDIYSLGVLLYELLTGSTPLDHKRMKDAAYGEILRRIKEEEPPRPSTRLSDSGEALASISARRKTEPAKLTKLVRGELDWLVMKTLEKDRNRRYETASSLALDVQRYLADEAVQACPPSAGYRLRKFARRNKGALAVSGLVLFFLVLLGSGIGWAVRDRTAREEQLAQERTARQMTVSGQLELILDEVARLQQAEKWSEARTSARRAEPALAEGEAPPDILERVRQALADLELVRRIEEIRAQSGTVWVTAGLHRLAAQADQEYAAAFRQAGIDVDALPVSEAVRRITARRAIAAALLPALDDWLAARIMGKNVEVRSIEKDEASIRRLIDVLHAADPDPWRQRVREALVRRDLSAMANLVTSADLDRQPAATLTLLYSALWASGMHREQELILRTAQWKYPADYWINHRLGVDLIYRQTPDDVRDGIGFMRAAVALRPESAHSVMNLGTGYFNLGQHDQAIAEYQKAIRLQKDFAMAHNNLGNALRAKGRLDEAIAEYQEAIRLQKDFAMAHNNLGLALRAEDRLDEAIAEFQEAIRLNKDDAVSHYNLGRALRTKGQFAQSLASLRRGHELGSKSPRWTYPSEAWVREGERLLALDEKLPDLLSGKVQSADTAERLALAQFCHMKKWYAAAARFWAEAFAAEPKLIGDQPSNYRYDAACAAALAGCGQGEDAKSLEEKERGRLRRQALDWLRADLAAWRRLLEKESVEARPGLLAQMQHWQMDADFAGVRGPDALGRLPAAERPDWEKLWQEVEELRQRAAVPANSDKKATAK